MIKYNCIHCGKKNISFYQKWRSTKRVPIECHDCKGRQYQGSILNSVYVNFEIMLLTAASVFVFLYFGWESMVLYGFSFIILEFIRTLIIPLVAIDKINGVATRNSD